MTRVLLVLAGVLLLAGCGGGGGSGDIRFLVFGDPEEIGPTER